MISSGGQISADRIVSGRSYDGGSYSQIRMTSDIDVSMASWRKSSWSAYNGGCVEVADLQYDRVGVRDTKAKGSGPVLIFTHAEWHSFLSSVKRGDLDFG
jgi:Domain of unknown function (DUF397)